MTSVVNGVGALAQEEDGEERPQNGGWCRFVWHPPPNLDIWTLVYTIYLLWNRTTLKKNTETLNNACTSFLVVWVRMDWHAWCCFSLFFSSLLMFLTFLYLVFFRFSSSLCCSPTLCTLRCPLSSCRRSRRKSVTPGLFLALWWL